MLESAPPQCYRMTSMTKATTRNIRANICNMRYEASYTPGCLYHLPSVTFEYAKSIKCILPLTALASVEKTSQLRGDAAPIPLSAAMLPSSDLMVASTAAHIGVSTLCRAPVYGHADCVDVVRYLRWHIHQNRVEDIEDTPL